MRDLHESNLFHERLHIEQFPRVSSPTQVPHGTSTRQTRPFNCVSPLSSVVERLSRKQEVGSSILSGGIFFEDFFVALIMTFTLMISLMDIFSSFWYD